MAVSVGVNKLSIVNSDSNGMSIAFPDVCLTPAPPRPPSPFLTQTSPSRATRLKAPRR